MPLSSEQEGLVVELLIEGADLTDLISRHFPAPETGYLLDALFLVLKQMGYFFTSERSPLVQYKKLLSQEELKNLEIIRNIRDAIAHRESPLHYLTPTLRIRGAWIFEAEDIILVYGKKRLHLLGDLFNLYIRLRELFAATAELQFLSKNPHWQIETDELKTCIDRLKGKIQTGLSGRST